MGVKVRIRRGDGSGIVVPDGRGVEEALPVYPQHHNRELLIRCHLISCDVLTELHQSYKAPWKLLPTTSTLSSLALYAARFMQLLNSNDEAALGGSRALVFERFLLRRFFSSYTSLNLCRSVPQDRQKIKINEQKLDAPGVYGEV